MIKVLCKSNRNYGSHYFITEDIDTTLPRKPKVCLQVCINGLNAAPFGNETINLILKRLKNLIWPGTPLLNTPELIAHLCCALPLLFKGP